MKNASGYFLFQSFRNAIRLRETLHKDDVRVVSASAQSDLVTPILLNNMQHCIPAITEAYSLFEASA